ncbi:MAG: biotin synthase BioB [Candidatus Omnitrophica bacterium]|nr:biotin synthase BioB [Candidatus Omnitrophota bacterium]
MNKEISKIVYKVLNASDVTFKEAKQIYLDKHISPFDLLWVANKIRERFKKNRVEICSIINAKSGNCPEDCKFCAQSAHHKAEIKKYPLLRRYEILKAAKKAKQNHASCFGVVTSGKGIKNPKEVLTICKAIRDIKKNIALLKCSVSLGIIDRQILLELKKAGLDRFHHNLETSKDYFPAICTTHTYEERLKTIENAKKLGFSLCSGGIFGIGEGKLDRLKLAFALRDLDVDSVPLNFLHPIKGTTLENSSPMSPIEILEIIAMFRIILPKKNIKVCGGRVVNLRSMQCMIFFAGANGMMIGNYLTRPGQDPAVDLQMIQDMGLCV